MGEEIKNKIEDVFRTSSNADQLFDSFNEALINNIIDVELYKILLGNPCLNFDEIKMYCSKLCEEFPQNAYDYFIWSATIFENSIDKLDALDNAISYYKYAAMVNPESIEPYLLLSCNYNYEVDVSTNEEILLSINDGLKFITEKSKIYFKLAEIYKKKSQLGIAKRYCELAETAQKEERKLRNNNLL